MMNAYRPKSKDLLPEGYGVVVFDIPTRTHQEVLQTNRYHLNQYYEHEKSRLHELSFFYSFCCRDIF